MHTHTMYLPCIPKTHNATPSATIDTRPIHQSIKLDDNSLSGTLPASWSTMSKLTELSVPYNQLTGTLPVAEWKAGMVSLILLNVPGNSGLNTSSTPPGWPETFYFDVPNPEFAIN